MRVDYQPGTHIIWSCSKYYGKNGTHAGEWDEPAIVVAVGASYRHGEKGRVKILCLDGQERWIWKSDIRPA